MKQCESETCRARRGGIPRALAIDAKFCDVCGKSVEGAGENNSVRPLEKPQESGTQQFIRRQGF